MNTIKMFLAASIAAAAIAGCNDPAKDKAKATVGEAKVVEQKAQNGEAYAFDSKASKLTFVGAKVTGKHEGSFTSFTGSVSLVDKNPEKSSVSVDVDAASITADSEKLTGHLKTKEFFDVETFKKVKFQSTAIKAGGEKGASHTVTGNLELHGVTKSITFPATIKVEGDAVNVDADFAINRKDFGIAYAGKVDDLIRDDVVVKLSIRAAKKPAS